MKTLYDYKSGTAHTQIVHQNRDDFFLSLSNLIQVMLLILFLNFDLSLGVLFCSLNPSSI